MKILIAEDSHEFQMIYSELMEYWGYDFDMASNGIEAVEFVRKNNGKYNFCIMNIEMPEMDGIVATLIIRKITTHFPIMGISTNDSYKKICFEVGMDSFVTRPCSPDDLLSKIKKFSKSL
ncbi:MAG: response regulator [Pseudomonadota bacterium]